MPTSVWAGIRTDYCSPIAAREKQRPARGAVEWGPVRFQRNGAMRVRSACESKAPGCRSRSPRAQPIAGPGRLRSSEGALDTDMGGTAGYDPHRNMTLGKCGGL
jgi:hypothetical protein